jgi:hypothetical protein
MKTDVPCDICHELKPLAYAGKKTICAECGDALTEQEWLRITTGKTGK